MATTKSKPTKRPKKPATSANGTLAAPTEVLTLAEAAAYLRVSEDDVVHAARSDDLVGRQIGGQWRFLKSNLEQWLSTPNKGNQNEAFLALAGSWKDDPHAEEMLKEIYERRRQTVEED